MKSIFVTMFAVIMLTGCNSPSKYSIDVRNISIDSEPTGANVYLVNPITEKETLLGTSPLTKQPVPVITAVKDRASWSDVDQVYTAINQARVIIVKPGFKPYIANFDTDPNKLTYHKVKLEKQ